MEIKNPEKDKCDTLFSTTKNFEILNVNKQIYNINWENKNPAYEVRNFNFNEKEYDTTSTTNGIIIDNGSFECRAGWSCSQEPNIRFRSQVGKPKVQTKGNESASNIFLVGDQMLSIDQGKLHKKSPFEKNYVTHFGTQEHLLDYIFDNFNISDTSVNHPVTFTEPLCNLNWSRKNISEIFFELYSVPSLCYGVDMLFSYDYNKNVINKNKLSNIDENKFSNCLIISTSYQNTHVVPIINGKINLDKTRRIGIGGFHGNELLTKSMNLRYPDLRAKFTPEIIKDIQEKYTMCAIDYHSQLQLLQKLFQSDQEKLRVEEKKRMFGSIEMYEKANIDEIIQKKTFDAKFRNLKPYRNMIDYQNEQFEDQQNIIKDLIFFELPKTVSEVVLTEEDMKRKQEVRKEQSRRLRELMQKKREENLRNLEKELQELEVVSELRSGDKYQFEEALLSKGYATYEELQNRINKIFLKINFNKESNGKVEGQDNIVTHQNDEKFDEEKRWPLLNITDEDLTDEQLKMKKIQKMQRQAYISRLEKREKQKRERERVEELKQRDPESYLVNLYKRKKEIVDRLEKYKSARRDITSRYSKANRGRMMVLAELGKEAKEGKKGEPQTDDFGINDEDWEVYRGISRHNLSEDEEEDQQMLQEIEAQIIESDPNYFKYSDDITQNLFYSSNHLTLGVDQFRGAELLFQPYIIGVDQAGLTEIILNVFKTMTFEEQKLLAGNIFITGGFAKTPYLKERLYNDLRMNLNCNIEININIAEDPELDAWKGARDFHINPDNQKYFITKENYNECGYDYFKEHNCSNNNIVYRGGSNFSYEISNKRQKTI